MRGCYKILSLIMVLLIALGILSVNVFAMEQKSTWPEGVLQAFYADEGSTRNNDWIDTTNRIISLPQGTEFDNGGKNHGVYHFYSDVQEGDIFYVHWVVRVHETPDADGEVIMSQDPAWLSAYTGKGQGEQELGTGPTLGLFDPESSDVFYEDLTPGQWTVLSYGFEVTVEGTNHVQHRIHFKNIAPIDVKYLIVTTDKITSLTCDPETGEIDGITNDNQYVASTPSPTPEPTPTPSKPATQQNTATAPATSTPSPTQAGGSGENNVNLILIIVIVAAVVVIGGVVIFLIVKNKKK